MICLRNMGIQKSWRQLLFVCLGIRKDRHSKDVPCEVAAFLCAAESRSDLIPLSFCV